MSSVIITLDIIMIAVSIIVYKLKFRQEEIIVKRKS